ncbi:hypothetical protein KUCAC02_021813 [Chaenocephalus aceratus]|uniref:Uncharacterized protein n=1 Tax=Chaenocephalus aceratus TaxID=36190 RepID=A0ACB9XH93_CHAAC|nr:hypothetical protein KUCAC02_021813 [Chaenocephalus aceratus]
MRSAQRRVFAPPAKPTSPTPQQAPTLNPSARKLNQRGASEGSRPLKTLHCLRKASPHRECSICNTVRGVAHYRPSPVPLCLFCAADRRIQLPSWANKHAAPGEQAVYIDEQIDLALEQDPRLTAT